MLRHRHSSPERVMGLACFCAAVVFGPACTGVIEDPLAVTGDSTGSTESAAGGTSGNSGASAGSAGSGGMVAAEVCKPGAFVPARLWRLSNDQYANSVRDLLRGLTAVAPLPVAAGATGELFPSPDSPATSNLLYQYHTVGDQAGKDMSARMDAFTGCAAGTASDTCAQQFIPVFASRAFRRPVTAEEVAALMAVYSEGQKDGPNQGIALVIEAVVQAPSFIYRAELGTPGKSKGDVRLTSYEVATALSFLFLNSIPDPPLWAAAQDGRLGTDAGIAAEVLRLMTDSKVQQNLTNVMLRTLKSDGVLNVTKDTKLYPQWKPALTASIVAETQLFVDDLMWHGSARLSDMFSSNRSFIDSLTAQLYNVPQPGGKPGKFVATMLPADQRAGLLTQASFLAQAAKPAQTSVIFRGLYVHDDVLGLPPIPQPPVSAKKDAQAASGDSEKAKAAVRAADPTCRVCHGQFDAFGIPFERYDSLGAYRSTLDGAPVDSAVDLTQPTSLVGRVEDGVQLAKKIAAGPEVATSMSNKMTGYALGAVAVDTDSCDVRDVSRALGTAQGNLIELFKTIGNSPALRVRQGGQP